MLWSSVGSIQASIVKRISGSQSPSKPKYVAYLMDMCVDICVDMCVDMRVDVCVAMCVDMYVDMCTDMCAVGMHRTRFITSRRGGSYGTSRFVPHASEV